MTQFYPFLVPGGLAVFTAMVGIVSLLRQRKHARAGVSEGKRRYA
jgi:hypothetical protein